MATQNENISLHLPRVQGNPLKTFSNVGSGRKHGSARKALGVVNRIDHVLNSTRVDKTPLTPSFDCGSTLKPSEKPSFLTPKPMVKSTFATKDSILKTGGDLCKTQPFKIFEENIAYPMKQPTLISRPDIEIFVPEFPEIEYAGVTDDFVDDYLDILPESEKITLSTLKTFLSSPEVEFKPLDVSLISTDVSELTSHMEYFDLPFNSSDSSLIDFDHTEIVDIPMDS